MTKYLGVIPAFDVFCLRKINSMPILYWSIKYARESKKMSNFIVLTNNREVERFVNSCEENVVKILERDFLKELSKIYKDANIVLLNPLIPIRLGGIIDVCINVFEKEKSASLITGFVDENKKFNKTRCVVVYDTKRILNESKDKKDIKYIVPEVYNFKCRTELELICVDGIMKHLGIRL